MHVVMIKRLDALYYYLMEPFNQMITFMINLANSLEFMIYRFEISKLLIKIP